MQILYAITDSFNCPLHITILLCIVNQMKPSTTERVLFFPFHFHISKNDTLFSIYKQTTLYYTTNKLESSFPEFSTSYFHSFHFFLFFHNFESSFDAKFCVHVYCTPIWLIRCVYQLYSSVFILSFIFQYLFWALN